MYCMILMVKYYFVEVCHFPKIALLCLNVKGVFRAVEIVAGIVDVHQRDFLSDVGHSVVYSEVLWIRTHSQFTSPFYRVLPKIPRRTYWGGVRDIDEEP